MVNFIDLVKKFEDKTRKSNPGYVTDYLGCITNIKHYNNLVGLDGAVLGFPEPNDGMLHEFTEYIGTCFAIDNAKDNFSCIELGAGNGIWSARSYLAAKKNGIKNIRLTAVEADPNKSKWISDNFNDNNIKNSIIPNIKIKIYNNAVGNESGFMYFPKLAIPSEDYGAVPTKFEVQTDYRGVKIENIKVEVVPLNKIINHTVDLLHVDIQGGESNLLNNAVDLLNKYVKVVLIGTHSRKIEGDLINLFYKNKWALLIETPCKFKYNPGIPSLEGMTIVDGNQVWVNPKYITINV